MNIKPKQLTLRDIDAGIKAKGDLLRLKESLRIKPEDLVVGAELVCTKSKSGRFIVGEVYTVDKLIDKHEITISNGMKSTWWTVDCICSSYPFEDWHTQFELHNKPKTVHQWGGQFELEQEKQTMTITTEQEIAKLEALTDELKIKLEGEQKAAPVNISFKDTGELAVALTKGRTFLTPNDLILSCDVTREGSPFICRSSSDYYSTSMDYTWDYFNDLKEIPSEFTPETVPWYLVKNFPFTKCYVSDSVSPPDSGCNVEFIAAFRSDRKRRFVDQDGAGWRYAVPVNNTTRGV